MSFPFTLPLALAALIVEALIGYPAPLYRAIGHPVTWLGRWLVFLETRLNGAGSSFTARRATGVLTQCLYLAPVALVAWATTWLCVWAGALGLLALVALAAVDLPSLLGKLRADIVAVPFHLGAHLLQHRAHKRRQSAPGNFSRRR